MRLKGAVNGGSGIGFEKGLPTKTLFRMVTNSIYAGGVDEKDFKPEKVIKWDDVLYALRIGDDFSRICELIAEHIYNYKYGKRKAFIIAENFDINTEFLKLYDWSSHKD